MARKVSTIRMPEPLMEEMDGVRTGSRTVFIIDAVREKIERERERARVASLASLVDEEAMDISNWMPAQRRAMASGD